MAGPANFLLQQIQQGARFDGADRMYRGAHQGANMLANIQQQQTRNALAKAGPMLAQGNLQGAMQSLGNAGEFDAAYKLYSDQQAAQLAQQKANQPMSAVGKVIADFKAGRIDQETRDIAINALRQRSQGGSETFGLNPIYGRDENGNVILMQPSNRGGVQPVQLPPGVQPAMPVQYLDTGTGFVPVGKRGEGAVGPAISKDVAGAEAAKKVGQARGDKMVSAPQAISEAQSSIGLIDKLLAHPGRTSATGGTAFTAMIPGTPAYDFAVAARQLEGKVFLEQFEKLKGGGQITEREGQAAKDAAARLDRAQTEGEYVGALMELRQIFQSAIARGQQNLAPQSGPARRRWNPNTGVIE